MMKVAFRYSWIYDQRYREVARRRRKPYPSQAVVQRWVRQRERAWRRVESLVLRAIERETGLKFHKGELRCYVVGRTIPFSDPLTLPIYQGLPASRFIDTLTHELIHVILSQTPQGSRRFRRLFQNLQKRWTRESLKTLIHISVHAVHGAVLLKLFGPKRLAANIRWLQDVHDYRRAWEIAKQIGYENVTRLLRNPQRRFTSITNPRPRAKES